MLTVNYILIIFYHPLFILPLTFWHQKDTACIVQFETVTLCNQIFLFAEWIVLLFNTIYSANIQGFVGVAPNITWNCIKIVCRCILLHFYFAKYNIAGYNLLNQSCHTAFIVKFGINYEFIQAVSYIHFLRSHCRLP